MADAKPLPLRATGLVVSYGGAPIVDGIDLAVGHGELLGLLGANGAGKSTLLRAITGQVPPDHGTIEIGGHDLRRHPERAKAHFGFAIDPDELPAPLSARQYFELVAAIRGVEPMAPPIADAIERLQFGPWLDQPIADCSLGTRAKIGIVGALIGLPPLLIFDESLNGLDPVAAWEAKAMLRNLAASGHAVILATHVVETVPGLCTRAVLLADGGIGRTWRTDELAVASAPTFEADVMAALRGRRVAA